MSVQTSVRWSSLVKVWYDVGLPVIRCLVVWGTDPDDAIGRVRDEARRVWPEQRVDILDLRRDRV